jgi:haloacetate dehalogenase
VVRGFEGFTETDLDANGIRIRAMIGGSGSPVLLLHGHPQNHLMWHKVVDAIAQGHTVVAADLRGYGDSDKPKSGADHAEYSKRAMAGDQVAAMEALGFEEFAVIGHDRGARVAHRMALDYADRITKISVLDVVPTHHVLNNVNRDLAFGYYHWFFFAQPADLPETLIGANPEYFLRKAMSKWTTAPSPFDDDVFADYVRCFSDPATLSASCEDFRAAASIDLVHDQESIAAGKRVTAPLLAIWGSRGYVGQHYDVLNVWRQYATDVRGEGLDCGHFMPEEDPAGTAEALVKFLAD